MSPGWNQSDPGRAEVNSGGALAGLRVLDLASLYAAPFVATLLADHGADVIKVEPPGGDAYRTYPTRMWPLIARNKRSVIVDVRTEAGASAIRALVKDVDVVVVNMPAELLSRIGLDWSTLAGLNPSLIYAHVSGYGLDGPAAGRPGNGTLGEAAAGLTYMTGDPDGPPMLSSVPLGDAFTGYVGAFGILAACYHRLAHGGDGQLIDINTVDAMLHSVGPMFTAFAEPAEPPSRLNGRLPYAELRNVFPTKDGSWVAISASTARHEQELRTLAGVPTDAAPGDESHPDLEAAVRAWTGSRSRCDVLDALVERRVPAANVNNAADVLADPHLRARHAVVPVDTAEFGAVLSPAPAPRLLGTPARTGGRTPRPGEHQDQVFGPAGAAPGKAGTAHG